LDKRTVLAANMVVILALAAILLASGATEGSVVALERGGSQVTNAGNVDISLEGSVTGMAVLAAGNSLEVEKEEHVKAEQV